MNTLVGVGVGPGDPELLTLAGLRVLREAGRIFVPVLAPDERGRAEAVVRAHIAGDEIERLVFALSDSVSGSQQRRRRHWDAAAERVAAHLRECHDCRDALIGAVVAHEFRQRLSQARRGQCPLEHLVVELRLADPRHALIGHHGILPRQCPAPELPDEVHAVPTGPVLQDIGGMILVFLV